MEILSIAQCNRECPSEWVGDLTDGRAFYIRYSGNTLTPGQSLAHWMIELHARNNSTNVPSAANFTKKQYRYETPHPKNLAGAV